MTEALPPARIVFTAPPPGLDPVTEFDLAGVDGAFGLYTLRSDAAGVRLFLLDPAFFVPNYRPEVADDQVSALEAGAPDELDLYVVATIDEGAPVVNLLAPIIVNPLTGAAAQVILDDDWPLRAQLIAPAA